MKRCHNTASHGRLLFSSSPSFVSQLVQLDSVLLVLSLEGRRKQVHKTTNEQECAKRGEKNADDRERRTGTSGGDVFTEPFIFVSSCLVAGAEVRQRGGDEG